MERLVSTKVDRIEFSQIIQNKANQADVQKILFEIINAKDANDLQQSCRLQNLMNESLHSTCSDDANITIMAPITNNSKNGGEHGNVLSFGNSAANQQFLSQMHLMAPNNHLDSI